MDTFQKVTQSYKVKFTNINITKISKYRTNHTYFTQTKSSHFINSQSSCKFIKFSRRKFPLTQVSRGESEPGRARS